MPEDTLDQQFVEDIRAALTRVGCLQPGPLTKSRPIRDLGLDSITLVEMVIHLEDRLNATLDPTDVDRLVTFGDLQELLARFPRQAAT